VTRWASRLGLLLGLLPSSRQDDHASKPAEPVAGSVREDMREIREHLRRVGAALGAAGGALLAGLGYTQIHKIFPLPTDSSGWLLVLAILLSFSALVGAAILTLRFYGAQRRIPVSTEPDKERLWGLWPSPRGFRKAEVGVRDRAFMLAARDEVATSLKAVELRAYRYARMARRGHESKAAAREEESKRLLAVVDTALGQGALEVLERRAHQAFNGWLTKFALLLTIAGIVGVFGLADWSQGQRDLVTLGKTCVEAKRPIAKCKRFGASATARKGGGVAQSSWLNGFRQTVLRREKVAYRVYGGVSRRVGAWFTTVRPATATRARSLLALPAENLARCVVRVVIPPGTSVRIGHAAPLFNQPGGGPQLQIRGSLKGIEFKVDKPLKPSKRPCP
jgi:hypothetical protein